MSPLPPARVLLVDDHKFFRQGVRILLDSNPGFTVVGEASDGREAIAAAAELRPDVIVMDVEMPELNGIAATRSITASSSAKVVALSAHSGDRYVREMLEAGASGYVRKECGFQRLIDAMKAVMSGVTFVDVPSRWRPDASGAGAADQGWSDRSVHLLSPREREVVQLIAEGIPTKLIAAKLGLSIKTVETHRKHITDKLGIDSVAGLTKFAVREGLTSLDF